MVYKNALAYWFDKECQLLNNKNADVHRVGGEAWAILETSRAEGLIDWDSERRLFGEFMSKYLGLR